MVRCRARFAITLKGRLPARKDTAANEQTRHSTRTQACTSTGLLGSEWASMTSLAGSSVILHLPLQRKTQSDTPIEKNLDLLGSRLLIP